MKSRFPFHYLEPAFFSGLLDDPVLLVKLRPLGRSLLVDCGQIHHLAKRVLKSVEALFITHAHMDHFMGIDTFTRNVHVSPKRFDLFGPPGMAGKLEHKLKGYDWNLTEQYWCSYRVHEIFPDHTETFILPGPEGFPCRFEGKAPRHDKTIYQNAFVKVETDLCDHMIPTLIFKFTERSPFLVDGRKIEKSGLIKGPWLKTLKRQFYDGEIGREPLKILQYKGKGPEEQLVTDTAALYQSIRKKQAPASIGYITDIGFTEDNLEKVFLLMKGVSLLICECTYLEEYLEKARVSYHLCAKDLNFLVRELRPEFLLPMHLSKTYMNRTHLLYEQLEIPSGVTLLRIPDRLTPRPLLPGDARL